MRHDRLQAIVGAGQFAQLSEDFIWYVGKHFRAMTRAISGIKPVQHAIVTSDINHGGSVFVGATEARVATAQAIWESRGTHAKGVGADELAKVAGANAVIVARALVGRAAAQVVQTCLPLSVRGAATGRGMQERLLGCVELSPAEGNTCFGVRVERENLSPCIIVLAGDSSARIPLFWQDVA